MTMALKEAGQDRFVAEFESLERDRFSVQPEHIRQLRKDAIIRFGSWGFRPSARRSGGLPT